MSRKLVLSTMVSIILLLAIFTSTGQNAIGQPQQTENQLEQQKFEFEKARNSFELKAADLLLNSKTPGQLHAKAKALIKMFPKAPLPIDFAESVKSFDPAEFSGPSMEWKIELFRLLAAPSANKREIINLWRQLFPGDAWIDRLNEAPKVTS